MRVRGGIDLNPRHIGAIRLRRHVPHGISHVAGLHSGDETVPGGLAARFHILENLRAGGAWRDNADLDPAARQLDAQANQIADALTKHGVKVGDRVVTSGGLIGKVAKVTDDEATPCSSTTGGPDPASPAT